MEKDFTEWLREHDCVWYLLSQEQEDKYFSQWYDEMQEVRKESEKNGLCNQEKGEIGR